MAAELSEQQPMPWAPEVPPPRRRGRAEVRIRANQDQDDPANAHDPGPHQNSAEARKSLVIGVTRLSWLYGRSRDWGERVLREQWEAQQAGTAPVRVFKQGARGSLYTTVAALSGWMPPGKDVNVYRRLKEHDEALAMDGTRIDREVIERKMAVAALERRVALLESRRKSG